MCLKNMKILLRKKEEENEKVLLTKQGRGASGRLKFPTLISCCSLRKKYFFFSTKLEQGLYLLCCTRILHASTVWYIRYTMPLLVLLTKTQLDNVFILYVLNRILVFLTFSSSWAFLLCQPVFSTLSLSLSL